MNQKPQVNVESLKDGRGAGGGEGVKQIRRTLGETLRKDIKSNFNIPQPWECFNMVDILI
jgi:hypothetical protein